MAQEKKITKAGKRRLKIVEKAFPRAYNRHAHFPEIKLSGRWLKDMGFDSGKHVIVSHKKNKITITLSRENDV